MIDDSTAGEIDPTTTSLTLSRLANARSQLALAHTLEDVMHIRDIAKATEVYLRAAHEAGEAANDAAEVRILAEHKAGGILRDMRENKQRVSSGGDYTNGASSHDVTKLETLGVSRMESHRWQRLSDIDPKIIEAYTRVTRANGEEVTTAGLMRALRDAESFLWRSTSKNAPTLIDGMELRIGDCREVLADIPDNSVSLIFTDPPYGNAEGVEPLYEWLGEFAARVLMPGGSMICLTGTINLNRDMRIFDQYLKYHWCLARVTHFGLHGVVHARGVSVGWKPMLWYVKQGRWNRIQVHDTIICDTKAPEFLDHDWEQTGDGVASIVQQLTDPGALVVDPFAGTAGWGRIIAESGRRWIGSDVISGGTTVAQ